MTHLFIAAHEHFRTHGQCFAEARLAINHGLHDQVVFLAEQMLGEGQQALRNLYDGLETGHVDGIRLAVGPGVRAWREAAGVSQREVAAYLGIDAGNLSKFERAWDDPATLMSPSLETALRAAVLLLLMADPKAPLGRVESVPDEGTLPLPALGHIVAELRSAAQKLPAPSGDLDQLIVAELTRGKAGPPARRLVLTLLRRPHSADALLAHLQSNELEDLRQALRNSSLEHLFDSLEHDVDSDATTPIDKEAR